MSANPGTNRDFTLAINAAIPAAEAQRRIAQVAQWWAGDGSGSAQAAGDRFTVRFGATFVDFTVAELIPARHSVWQVTASHLHFIADTREWDGTRVVFDLAESAGVTTVRMTHVGLRPGIACYDNCQAGWTFYIGTSLRALLNGGPGQPDGRRARNR